MSAVNCLLKLSSLVRPAAWNYLSCDRLEYKHPIMPCQHIAVVIWQGEREIERERRREREEGRESCTDRGAAGSGLVVMWLLSPGKGLPDPHPHPTAPVDCCYRRLTDQSDRDRAEVTRRSFRIQQVSNGSTNTWSR